MGDFIRNDEIQAAMVAYLKAQPSIVAEIPALEIRENEWQGRDFTYPCIRFRMISNVPSSDTREPCMHNIVLAIQVFTEDASTQTADRVSGIISSVLHGRSFTSNLLHFSLLVTNSLPAVRSDTRTWRSEVMLRGIVSG